MTIFSFSNFHKKDQKKKKIYKKAHTLYLSMTLSWSFLLWKFDLKINYVNNLWLSKINIIK